MEERCKAVQWTKRSIEQAGAVRAKAVVLHCGRIEMNAEREWLKVIELKPGTPESEVASGNHYPAKKMKT